MLDHMETVAVLLFVDQSSEGNERLALLDCTIRTNVYLFIVSHASAAQQMDINQGNQGNGYYQKRWLVTHTLQPSAHLLDIRGQRTAQSSDVALFYLVCPKKK